MATLTTSATSTLSKLSLSYIPQNQAIYEAAFAGAYTGMSAGRYLTNTDPSEYTPSALDAVSWAQALDQAVARVLGAGTPATQLHVDIVRKESFGAWEGRQVLDTADYTREAAAVAAMMMAGDATFVVNGGNASPTPAGLPADTGVGSILVFRPGAVYGPTSPQPSNVFTDGPSLLAALATVASSAIVRVDSSRAPKGIATLPGTMGVINLGYGVTFEPANTDYDTNTLAITAPADILELEPGASFLGLRGINGPLRIQARCTLGSAITMQAGDTLSLSNGAALVLLSGSTSPLVHGVPNSPTAIDVSPNFGLLTDGQVLLQSQSAGVPVIGLGYTTTASSGATNFAVFASRSLYLEGLVFGGNGTVNFNFDGTGVPLLAGPGQPVAVGVEVVNALQSQVSQSSLVFYAGPQLVKSILPLAYGNACTSWDEVMAWVNCRNNTVTDITIAIPTNTSSATNGTYTLTPDTPGQIYDLSGITLHGADAPDNGTLILGDGVILRDLAGISDGLTVMAVAATTTPLIFSNPGASFFVDGGASLSFVPSNVVPVETAVKKIAKAMAPAASAPTAPVTSVATAASPAASATNAPPQPAKPVASSSATPSPTQPAPVASAPATTAPITSAAPQPAPVATPPSPAPTLVAPPTTTTAAPTTAAPATSVISATPPSATPSPTQPAPGLPPPVTAPTATTAIPSQAVNVVAPPAPAPPITAVSQTVTTPPGSSAVSQPVKVVSGASPTSSALQSGPPAGSVPVMSISGPLSPFDLSVTDGGSIQSTNGPVGVIALADAGAVVHVVAKGGETTSGQAFNGLVFSGPPGAELYFAHDATVLPPLLSLFQGQFFDIRLSMAANLAPSTGGAVVAPSNGVVGDLFYASDIQALCVCIGAGRWVSTNATTGTAAAIPATGIMGQLYYATDSGQLSIWSGTAWAPLGLTSGLAAALPTTGTQGQMYLQSDTGKLSVWNNGKWISAQLA